MPRKEVSPGTPIEPYRHEEEEAPNVIAGPVPQSDRNVSDDRPTPLASSLELAHLQQEADHYFTAEVQQEQRASWLLALSLGYLAILHQSTDPNSPSLSLFRQSLWHTLGILGLVGSMLLAVVAIWPLHGANGKPVSPFWRPGTQPQTHAVTLEVIRRHYCSHRYRAELKARRVAWALILLVAGALCSIAGFTLGS